MPLLLFDIDGTLVRVNGASRTAVARALSPLCDRPISTEPVPFSGRTDPLIFKDILEHNDLPATDAAIADAIERYVDAMQAVLSAADVTVLPGVRALLDRLHDHPDVHLGLVTGNVEPIAYAKLSVQGLADYFPIGAFGSDHADRNRLPQIAARRAADHNGRPLDSASPLVIGDTPHDVACARAAGARVMAVCTGRYTRGELVREGPDLLHDTLPDSDAFLEELGLAA